MRTAIECLAKASELEERATRCAEPAARSQYLEAAIYWRDLARRALIHAQYRGARSSADATFRFTEQS